MCIFFLLYFSLKFYMKKYLWWNVIDWKCGGWVAGWWKRRKYKTFRKKRFQFRNCNQSSICRFHMHASINLMSPNYFRVVHMQDSPHREVFHLGPLPHPLQLDSWGWPSRFYDCTRPNSDCTMNNANAHVLARGISMAGSKRASRLISWQHQMMNLLSLE